MPEENLACPVIGRRLLESIGCDNRIMLQAASNNNGGVVDISKTVDHDDDIAKNESRIALLFWELLYHNSIINDEDGIDERFECLEFGDDSQLKIDEKLLKRVHEAEKEVMSKRGCKKFQALLQGHKSVFKLRIGRHGPAHITP